MSSLTRFLKNEGAALHKAISGPRTLRDVRAICETDRWNSFDRFHDTTAYLTDGYGEAGAVPEVYPIRTGGEAGDGRWTIREASDIRSATVDVVSPVKQRLIDYKQNPWQVIQWSAATPRGGLKSDLIIIDTEKELSKRRSEVNDKTVLTKLNTKHLIGLLSKAGAAAVISDRGVPNLPNATAWTKFGWGSIPLEHATARLVGLVLSTREGLRLRKLAGRHDKVTLHLKVDVRPYIGDHDLVSGIVKGADDPEEELWVLAHSAEPGAIDNASGVAVCLESARALESAIQAGTIKRPKRSIRFLSGFECYSFFNYMEYERRYQTPIAGLCVDTVGARPDVCDGQFAWRASIPMSATFVDRIGETVARSAIRRTRPGYRLTPGPFMSTSDTLAGDPKYGFPCPWITTHYRKGGKVWDAYHSSADVPALLSPAGLATATLTTSAYLLYLADAGNREIADIAQSETDRTVAQIRRLKSPDKAEYLRIQHHQSMERLTRWIWGGSRNEVLSHLADQEKKVRNAGPKKRRTSSKHASHGRIPRRTRALAPTLEDTREPIASQIRSAGLSQWALFWADGKRSIDEIARLISQETGREITPDIVATYFEAHRDLGYVSLIVPQDIITKSRLVSDFKRLGVKAGQNVMMHSSLSAVGHVDGGPNTVIDALLSILGKRGTLVMPSFNHGWARVYNPRTSPSVSGAIPDAFWRRPGVLRSNQTSHAVAAYGPLAADIVAGHVEAGIWTVQSPLARFIRAGGYVLSLGVTHTSSTVYHVGEMSVPCGCIDPVGNRGKLVDKTGNIRVVPGLSWRAQPCPIGPEKLNQTLTKNPKQKSAKVGNAASTLVSAKLIYDTRRRHLRNICPTCTIKPHCET
jgi:aminoglycoside N3'-acetyltransferase